MRVRIRLLAAIAALAPLAVAGCGGSSSGPTGPATIRLYGTDGNMSNSFGASFTTPGAIAGMMGTAPLTPLSEDFKRRLHAVDPSLPDVNYAGEAYDAVVIAALAVQIARSTDPRVVATFIDGVTQRSADGVECRTVPDCLAAIARGTDIGYRGVAVHDGFTSAGEPATASYGTLHFGRDNRIDDGKTEYVLAGSASASSTKPEPTPPPVTDRYRGDALRLGVLLPRSGQLKLQGLPMFAGVHLAVKEINAAGGILGHSVQETDADAGTDPAIATARFAEFVSQGIPIVIGPASSGSSAAVIPKAVAAGKILFSPSATSASLSAIDDHGLFFRACPPDSYQAQALTDVIMRGGARRVFIVGRDDSYGTGLRDAVTKDLTTAGVKASDIGSQMYQDKQQDYHSLAQAVRDFHPDAVLVAGFEESAAVVKAIQADGVTFNAG